MPRTRKSRRFVGELGLDEPLDEDVTRAVSQREPENPFGQKHCPCRHTPISLHPPMQESSRERTTSNAVFFCV